MPEYKTEIKMDMLAMKVISIQNSGVELSSYGCYAIVDDSLYGVITNHDEQALKIPRKGNLRFIVKSASKAQVFRSTSIALESLKTSRSFAIKLSPNLAEEGANWELRLSIEESLEESKDTQSPEPSDEHILLVKAENEELKNKLSVSELNREVLESKTSDLQYEVKALRKDKQKLKNELEEKDILIGDLKKDISSKDKYIALLEKKLGVSKEMPIFDLKINEKSQLTPHKSVLKKRNTKSVSSLSSKFLKEKEREKKEILNVETERKIEEDERDNVNICDLQFNIPDDTELNDPCEIQEINQVFTEEIEETDKDESADADLNKVLENEKDSGRLSDRDRDLRPKIYIKKRTEIDYLLEQAGAQDKFKKLSEGIYKFEGQVVTAFLRERKLFIKEKGDTFTLNEFLKKKGEHEISKHFSSPSLNKNKKSEIRLSHSPSKSSYKVMPGTQKRTNLSIVSPILQNKYINRRS